MSVRPPLVRLNPHWPLAGGIAAPTHGDDGIDEAERWLTDQGYLTAYGPIEASTWLAYRANLGPHDRPPFHGEPSASPAPWRTRSYEEAARYVSVRHEHDAQWAKARPHAERLRAAGWRLRPFAGHADLPELYRVASQAFTQAFLYSPISEPDFLALYAPLAELLDPRFVHLAISPDGHLAGFCLTLPDQDQLIIKSLAVLPEFHRDGVGTWLVGESHRFASRVGLSGGGIHALMRSDAISPRIGADRGRLVRSYVLYRKALRPGTP